MEPYTRKSMILLIDDNNLSRRVYGRLLKEKGYEVLEAADGNEALKLIDENVFDLIISDLILPDLDGRKLISLIRAKWPKIPIILISGHLLEEADKVILDGPTRFILKPIDLNDLTEAVQRLIPKSD
jgi:two-component system cell cycle sensor histidine kinase/response regulator CckA